MLQKTSGESYDTIWGSIPFRVRYVLRSARQLLDGSVPTPQLDADILLAHLLGVDRAWLIAHGDEELESLKVRKFESVVRRRLDREPVAYIVGHKEFYGREFIVTPDVLIPRPETETMIDILKQIYREGRRKKAVGSRLVDVGCGSGCIGITAKLEMPEFDVTLCDISEPALAIARRNAKRLRANVDIVLSDLLSKVEIRNSKFDYILANLPYVDHAWQTSPELRHEPEIALYAQDQGLALIKTLIPQASSLLVPHGYLLLEADPCQHEEITTYGERYGLAVVEVRDYVVAMQHIDH